MIKKLFFTLILCICFNQIEAQCNYNTNRINNVTVKEFDPSLVAFDKDYQVGVSLGKVKDDIILTLLVRFTGNAKKTGSNLLIFTDGENAVELEYIDSQKDYMAGSEISLTKFKIMPIQYGNLIDKGLKTFRFKFANEDIYRTFEIEKNKGVISTQLICFTGK